MHFYLFRLSSRLVFFRVKYHTLGHFYVGEMETEVTINKDDMCSKDVLKWAKDLYHMERGDLNIGLELKLHCLVPGKSLTDSLMYFCDDYYLKKIDTTKREEKVMLHRNDE